MTGVVTDDLVENNRDVRPLVCYVTGDRYGKKRKGRSIVRRVPTTIIHYTLDAIYVSSYELHVNVPENRIVNFSPFL